MKKLIIMLLATILGKTMAITPSISPTVEAKIETIENSLRGNNFETAVAFDPATGAIIRTIVGGPDFVAFSKLLQKQVRFAVLTHNHPKSEGLVWFSEQDIALATLEDFQQMRVTGYDQNGVATTCVADIGNKAFWPTGLPDIGMKTIHDTAQKVTYGQLYDEGAEIINAMVIREGGKAWVELFKKWDIAYWCFEAKN